MGRAADRLATLTRDRGADLAEVALLVAAAGDPRLDVAASLLRVDALADRVRTSGSWRDDPEGWRRTDPAGAAANLRDVLGHELGFGGGSGPRTPDDALLHRVLQRRHGLPVTLSVLWVAIARRCRIPAFVVNLPGHVVAAVGGSAGAVVIDPWDGGRPLDEDGVAARLREATGGAVPYTRALLRPAPPADVARRILDNLTHDLLSQGDPRSALWTIETKLVLPNAIAEDHRLHAELLAHGGAFAAAARAYERYLEGAPDADDREEIRLLARRARARLN